MAYNIKNTSYNMKAKIRAVLYSRPLVLVRNENENKKIVRFRFRFGNDKGRP